MQDPGTGIAPFVVPLPPSTESAPAAIKVIALPLSWAFGTIRTAAVVALLLVHTVIVEGALLVLLAVPALHQPMAGFLTALHARLILLLLGFVFVQADTISLKRTGRSPPNVAFAPQQGDVIVANSSSYIDVLYLAFRYNPTFLLPTTSANSPAKVTGWKSAGLLRALLSSGKLPSSASAGENLGDAVHNAPGPVVIFPECTTSNNRALLKLANLSAAGATKPKPVRTFLLAFKRLHPSESPKLSTGSKQEDWDVIGDTIASVGRLKRVNGLDVESKVAFIEYRKKR
ncbi:hypothetical protein OIO90_000924 [Microbotryomycetes sp. JL221]|nr:hypothetical protein OIO90_000924 [Microbotryomycetes sp. JL221]